jgi:protein-S-isoprenylcysteine O-methyltransferase Ste14
VSQRSLLLGYLRLLLVYLFVAALAVLSRPGPVDLLVGVALILVGETIRVWAAGHLVKSVKLITSGPYAYCQNPLYLGRLLILTGLGLAARMEWHLNLVALGIGYGIFFLYYMPRKLRVEGQRLATQHGEAFEAYRRRVPVLFPTLRSYGGDRTAWSFRLMVHNQEPLVAAGLALLVALLAWRGTR